MDYLIRFVFSRWIVALVALGLASAPLHAAARMFDAGSGVSGQGGVAAQALHGIHGQPDHHHSGASKSHAAGQFCCHPSCIMAVFPVPANLAQGMPLSEVVPIPPDLTPVPALLFGIDRPPKRA